MSDNPPRPEPSPPAEAGTPTTVTNVSGGVNLDAQGDVNIGGDVVGRDKIIQAGTYIEHATIIQSGVAVQEVEPATPIAPLSTENHRLMGGMEFVRVRGEFMGSVSS
jgi:hypothetical protein